MNETKHPIKLNISSRGSTDHGWRVMGNFQCICGERHNVSVEVPSDNSIATVSTSCASDRKVSLLVAWAQDEEDLKWWNRADQLTGTTSVQTDRIRTIIKSSGHETYLARVAALEAENNNQNTARPETAKTIAPPGVAYFVSRLEPIRDRNGLQWKPTQDFGGPYATREEAEQKIKSFAMFNTFRFEIREIEVQH